MRKIGQRALQPRNVLDNLVRQYPSVNQEKIASHLRWVLEQLKGDGERSLSPDDYGVLEALVWSDSIVAYLNVASMLIT